MTLLLQGILQIQMKNNKGSEGLQESAEYNLLNFKYTKDFLNLFLVL